MNPLIAGGLIKAGGSLLGGLFGKDAPKPSAMIISHMKGIREGAERYGFNPLAWAGTSPTAGQAPPNYMGAAISDAFASVADAYSQNAAEKAEADQLRQENEELRAAARMETIRPTMPGLYGRVSAGASGKPWASPYDPVTPEERQRAVELAYAGRGATLETDKYGYPVFVEGGATDRPEEVSTVKNEAWYKKLNFGGRDLYVWNDEASDNEFASTAVVASLPWQYAFQKVRDRVSRGFRHEDGTPQNFFPEFMWGDPKYGKDAVPLKSWEQKYEF